ncbi:MAG TPA: carbamate kinase [Candidatus Saccharimonadales bacterium]|nr:carbamate kinase [Candidatus Saccharimonadales bacterium]
MPTESKRLAILAVGGNSLIADDAHKSVEDQFHAVEETCRHIAGLLQKGYRVVVTHGNGPQVGFILRRSELARHELHDVPLDSCGADTQGAIGYQVQRAMFNQMKNWPTRPVVATVVTQVLVDHDDPSFKKPSKPIGSFMNEGDAKEHRQKDGWDVVEDAGRGWRRVVASPRPRRIVELEAIRRLLESDIMVVAVGGGGIPVVQDAGGNLVGAAAVIDKDLATSLLARELKADLLIISTAVEKVCLNYRKPDQKDLDRITLAEAKKYLAEGHFAPGSMKPKMEAVIEFLEAGGKQALITDPQHLVPAVEGKTGTWIVA